MVYISLWYAVLFWREADRDLPEMICRFFLQMYYY